MHPSGGRQGYPQGYYGAPQHPGHMVPPNYHHMPSAPTNPSFQSMTSHWNLTPTPMAHPASAYHPHLPVSATSSNSGGGGGGGGNSKSKYAHLGQFGLTMQQPKAPEKPLLPYMRYSRKMWEELKAEGKKVWEVQTVGKLIGQKWREMSEEDKQPFCDEYESEKLVYNEQLKVYRNSTAYKRWLEAKTQAEAAREAALQAASSATATSSSSQFHSDYLSSPHSTLPRQSHTDSRVVMQQQQQQIEEEEDEYISKKQLSAMRYHRNHRLMQVLFDEVPVPDCRCVVDRNRFLVLKNQVQSLMKHQKKLEDEVCKIDTQYEAKKRKFLEDSDKFRRELKRIQDHPPSSWKKPLSAFNAIDLPDSKSNTKYTKL